MQDAFCPRYRKPALRDTVMESMENTMAITVTGDMDTVIDMVPMDMAMVMEKTMEKRGHPKLKAEAHSAAEKRMA